MKIECPQCRSSRRQTKAGLTRAGSQRYFCIVCIKTYTPQPKVQGHPPALRQQAVTMCLEGVCRSKVARSLQVAPQSVGNWCQQAQQRLEQSGQTPLPQDATLACAVIEMDELYSFVGAKRGEKKR